MAGISNVRHWRAKLGLALLLAVLIMVTTYKYMRLRPHVSSLIERARALQTLTNQDSASLANPARLVWMREQLGNTRADLESIRAEMGPLLSLAERLSWVPRVGEDLAAAPALLDTAIYLCDAGWWGLLGLEPVMDTTSHTAEGSSQTALEAALPVLIVSRPRFAEAEKALMQAQVAWDRVEGQNLSPRLAKWAARLERYLPLLKAAAQLAQAIPGMLGQERPVTYLILAQNNHELRATGGFISGVGVIQLSGGKIITATFEDSYQADAGCNIRAHPPAPAPLRKYMWAPVLMLRDANWSPDFPSSAAVAKSIYRLCRSSDIDGVIAIDLDGVAALLQALGPLQPEGYPTPVTSATLLEYVAKYWTVPLRSASMDENTGQWWTHRKDFMADLLQAALQKVTTAPQSIDPLKLAQAALASFQGKHLLVYLFDSPAAARAFATTGWDGALRPSKGDYLMLVDSNVGFRKVNPKIRQSIDYHVDLSGSRKPRASLKVRYANESKGAPECIAGARYDASYEQMMQGCYWDYVRVYVPRGSHVLEVVGGDSEPEVSEEAGKAVISVFLVIAPGESRELAFDYELPSAGVMNSSLPEYHLLIQKQPGSSDLPVQASILGGNWRLGAFLSDAAPSSAEGQVRFNLASDTQLIWVAAGIEDSRASWLWATLGLSGAIMVLMGFAIWAWPRRMSARD